MTSAGRIGEDAAAQYLEARGLSVLDRNYRFLHEEVDIVCFHPYPEGEGGEIVFVEVKARRGDRFGRPEDAVGPSKQRAIMRVAEAYLFERKLSGAIVRFDVVAVDLSKHPPAIEHTENAFGYFV
jgi:putative endonuclease